MADERKFDQPCIVLPEGHTWFGGRLADGTIMAFSDEEPPQVCMMRDGEWYKTVDSGNGDHSFLLEKIDG